MKLHDRIPLPPPGFKMPKVKVCPKPFWPPDESAVETVKAMVRRGQMTAEGGAKVLHELYGVSIELEQPETPTRPPESA